LAPDALFLVKHLLGRLTQHSFQVILKDRWQRSLPKVNINSGAMLTMKLGIFHSVQQRRKLTSKVDTTLLIFFLYMI
jgi:hypothetical protein